MLAKVQPQSLSRLKTWASLVKMARARALRIATFEGSLRFSASSDASLGYGLRMGAAALYGTLTVEAEVSDSGSCLAAPGVLLDVLTSMSVSGGCALSFDGTELCVAGGECTFSLNTVSEERPVYALPLVAEGAPQDWSAKLPGTGLRKSLAHGAVCATGRNYGHRWQECVHMVVKPGQLDFESSNGFVLAKSSVEAKVEGQGDACVAAAYAVAIARLLQEGDVTVSRYGNVLSFEGKDVSAQVALWEGNFPDTDKIVAPRKDNASISVALKVAELRTVTQRISALCDNDTYSDNLMLSVSPLGARAAFKKEQVGFFENDLEAEVSGEEAEVYLGAGFVESVLNEIHSDKVNLYIGGPGSPVRMEPAIDDPKETYIVAPRSSPKVQQVEDMEPPKEAAAAQ